MAVHLVEPIDDARGDGEDFIVELSVGELLMGVDECWCVPPLVAPFLREEDIPQACSQGCFCRAGCARPCHCATNRFNAWVTTSGLCVGQKLGIEERMNEP